MVSKTELLEDARRDRARFEAEVAAREEQVARGEIEYRETPMRLVHKTHERLSPHLTDAELARHIDQRIAQAVESIKQQTLPEAIDIIAEAVGDELSVMRKRLDLLDTALKESTGRVLDDVVATSSRSKAESERLVKELSAIRKSMSTLAKQVETMKSGGGDGNVRRIYAN
jgi:hypothetical protein